MMKKEKLPIENKSSWIPVVLCIIVLIVAVGCLPLLNKTFWKSNTPSIEEKVKESKVPKSYQCTYGPIYDEFYQYTKYESILFEFDKNGNISSVNSEIKYQVYSLNAYKHLLDVLTLPSENVIYDEENYVITVSDITSARFPSNYTDVRQYLSNNQYTCVSVS